MSLASCSSDDLATPLSGVTFCVLDLETTGTDPARDAITEIGMVKVRGGECIGTLHTHVNLGEAPCIGAVLPVIVEFVRGCVLVGHNIRFDIAFLNAALARCGWERIRHRTVDTLMLARRLLREDVENCQLGTLAERLHLAHRPTHRALEDAWATSDLLHVLLERAGPLGVLGLDDLLALPRLGASRHTSKLRLTVALPRRSGVYVFLGSGGEVLYVGRAGNLRERVRSYFVRDEPATVVSLLREVQAIRVVECVQPIEAAVRELRLLHRHSPRHNRRDRPRAAYVKIMPPRSPRPTVVVSAGADGALYLGPLPSRATARTAIEAVHTALALLGRDRVVRGLTDEPRLVLEPLREQMTWLAANRRYEEAGRLRDQAATLASALTRQHRLDSLRATGRLRAELHDGGGVELWNGVLSAVWDAEGATRHLPPPDGGMPMSGLPLLPHHADELAAVADWLDAEAGRMRVEQCERNTGGSVPPCG